MRGRRNRLADGLALCAMGLGLGGSTPVVAQPPDEAPGHQFVSGRLGVTGGLGVEYARDLHRVVQIAVSVSSWVLFSEAGADARLFFARKDRTRFYAGPGLRAQNSPLLYTLAITANAEAGLEYVDRRGFAFGAGLGAAFLFVVPGLPSEGSGFQGALPIVGLRLGRAWTLRR